MTLKDKNTRKQFAIYARFSSEMQNEISIRSQIEQCTQAIAQRNGVVVDIFTDEATNGWSLDRPGFNELRRAAENKRFEAIMFWKFDRLARNHNDIVIIKMLLRQDLNLSLHCVQGVSEDDDNTPYGALMEQLLAIFSAYYSKNLSSETKRGKKHRAINGAFNGSIAPLGYELVTKKYPDKMKREPGLYIVPRAAAIVRRAFRMYASGFYSDRDIADWMNTRRYIQQLRRGQKPVNKGMVRDMLMNRTYTGRVSYAETEYSKTLGKGKKSPRRRKTWYEGKHQGFVSDEIFDQCQEVRKQNTKTRKTRQNRRTYLLNDRVYCAYCMLSKPLSVQDEKYGKMRAKTPQRTGYGYYRCITRDRSYKTNCKQRFIRVETVDAQVIDFLFNLQIPEGVEERIERAVSTNLSNAQAIARMEELLTQMENMDIRFDHGFYTDRESYFDERQALQQKYEALRPVEHDHLTNAKGLLQNFQLYWEECNNAPEPEEERQRLIKQVVERVFVQDNQVIAISLYGSYAVVLGEVGMLGSQVVEKLGELKNGNITTNVSIQFGSDEI